MKYLTAIILFLSLISCEQKEEPVRTDGFTPILKTAEDSLFHDVMEGHDVGMAKMGRISKYITQSGQMIDSLKKLPSNSTNKEMISRYEALKMQLQEADDDMSNWMMNFKADSLEGKSERKGYLENEKIKVERVRVKIMDAVAAGDSLLTKR
ncbi:MAG: hypothetical protein ACXWV5_12485 [Flavitalea sp.]